MLVFTFYTKEGEEHEEHEEVIHRERFLYQITSQEFHSLLMGLHGIEEVDARTEYERYAYPDGRHLQGFSHAYLMLTFLAKRLQVDDEHNEYQYIKQNPSPQGHTYYFHIGCKDNVN